MAVARPGYFWDDAAQEWAPIGIAPEGSEVTDHNQLSGRNSPQSHPIVAVDGLTEALDGKAPTGHTHSGLNIQAGEGIDLSGGDPNVISNTDLGSDALEAHQGEVDPHPIYSQLEHEHDYAAADHTHPGTDHDHPSYEIAGTAAELIDTHVAEVDPHPAYLLPPEVQSSDGISVTDNGDGTITLLNTAMNGQPLVAAALVASADQSIPTATWTPLTNLVVPDGDSGNLIPDPPDGSFLIPQAGAYIFTAAVGFAAGGGARGIRMTRNGTPVPGSTSMVNAPTGQPSALPTAVQIDLRPDDVIRVEAFQTSGNPLDAEAASCRSTISRVNGATSDRIVGVAVTQTTVRTYQTATWTGIICDTTVLNTIDATVGTNQATAGVTLGPDSPEGWYDLVVSIGFAGDNNGNRRLRVLVNDVITNAPLIPNMNVLSAGGGIITPVQVAGPVYLKPGDYLRPEGFQNTSGNLDSAPANTAWSLLFRGIDVGQAEDNPAGWTPLAAPPIVAPGE